jgi:hypothetical protein
MIYETFLGLRKKFKSAETKTETCFQNHWFYGLCPSSRILTGELFRIPEDGQINKPSDSECYTSSSEPFRFCLKVTMFNKVKVSLWKFKYHNMKAFGGVEV